MTAPICDSGPRRAELASGNTLAYKQKSKKSAAVPKVLPLQTRVVLKL